MYAAKLLILWLVCVSLSVRGCPSIALRCLAKALRISIWENLYAVRSLHMNLEQANDWGWPNLALLFQVPLAPEPAGFSKRLPGRFLFIALWCFVKVPRAASGKAWLRSPLCLELVQGTKGANCNQVYSRWSAETLGWSWLAEDQARLSLSIRTIRPWPDLCQSSCFWWRVYLVNA